VEFSSKSDASYDIHEELTPQGESKNPASLGSVREVHSAGRYGLDVVYVGLAVKLGQEKILVRIESANGRARP
jgi:hypothetical protein